MGFLGVSLRNRDVILLGGIPKGPLRDPFWDFLGIPLGFLRDSFGMPLGFLRNSLRIPLGFLRDSLGIPKGFLRDS